MRADCSGFAAIWRPLATLEIRIPTELGGTDVGRYDFATRYLVGFAPVSAFRHLSSDEHSGPAEGLDRVCYAGVMARQP